MVVIMVVTSRRECVDVVVVGAEVGMEEKMMEEKVVILEGCRMLDGVGVVGGALRLLGHLGGEMPRLTGDDLSLPLLWSFSLRLLTQCFIYDYMLSFGSRSLFLF